MNKKEIRKTYSDLLIEVENAKGRKEVVKLLKKAALIRSKLEINNYMTK